MDTVSQELLPHWQKKMMLMCWIAYVCAYLVRTNLSVALPGMSADFRWSNAAAGLIGTAFFWCYAIGQLINGFVGDKFTSRGLVFLGLLASGIFNILVGLSNNYIAIIIFWAFNGFVLSMLWGPIVRTTAAWFPESRRTGVAVILSLSMIGGYIISWGGVAQLASVLGWRCDFLLPASVTLIFAFIWLWQARSDPHQLGLEVTDDVPQPAGQPPREPEKPEAVIKKSTLEIFIENRFWFLACACLSLGFVKEGILLWSPTFLIKAQRLSPSAASAFSLVIPVIGTAGILLSGWLHKLMHNQSKKAAAVLFNGRGAQQRAARFPQAFVSAGGRRAARAHGRLHVWGQYDPSHHRALQLRQVRQNIHGRRHARFLLVYRRGLHGHRDRRGDRHRRVGRRNFIVGSTFSFRRNEYNVVIQGGPQCSPREN
jgi:sugar phosphate permease